MSIPGVPGEGFRTVDQIVGTNELLFHEGQNALRIAVKILSTHTPGAPVVDRNGKFVGFISEFDLLGALELGKDLDTLTAEEIMAKDPIVVHESTTIKAATTMMKEKDLLNLPVERNGKVVYSLTRHDLLRAQIGLGLDIEG